MRLIADTHTHTLASNHAYSTVMENIAAAREQGLLYMAMTEHGPKMPDAPHIWHCVNQWEVPSLYKGLNILHGIEVDVMDEDGTLDIDNRVLAGLEWVIASMHGPCFAPATEQEHTRAWMKVAENPHVDVIGHCGRGNYPFDHEKVIRAFKEYGKIVEINNATLQKSANHAACADIARVCKRLEVPVVVNSDAHFAARIGVFDQAVALLEEVDFPKKLIINADIDRFEEVSRRSARASTNKSRKQRKEYADGLSGCCGKGAAGRPLPARGDPRPVGRTDEKSHQL